MSGRDVDEDGVLQFEMELTARPETVWRALSEESYRRAWLPDQTVLEVLQEARPERLSLLVEETTPPHAQGIVTFDLEPGPQGGTRLRLVHLYRPAALPAPANDRGGVLMRLAA